MGLAATDGGEWKFWKYVEEPEFGPGFPVHNVFITGQLVAGKNLQGLLIPALIYFFGIGFLVRCYSAYFLYTGATTFASSTKNLYLRIKKSSVVLVIVFVFCMGLP